ncbi:MAG: 5-bromo-4-chloroindolyl phosphate hydrolysis family protein [Lachnospiraceae bacterium]|nr:5-bromo-4-chloroindolyl phosphate hydrolysis family protein [Lachnospiraceae bacterium]
MSRKRSGGGVIFGLIVIVAAIALLFFVHHALPGLFKLLLGIGLFIIALFVALIVVIIVAARKGTKKMAEKSQQAAARTVNKSGLTPEQASVINKGRSDLVAIRMVNSRIRNAEIKKSVANVGATAEKILVALKEKPETIKSARQFTNYYLPTLRAVLEKFQRIEQSGVDQEGAGDRVIKYLADVQKALDRQYTNLFDNDKFDLSVDMDAMTIALKRDGLIDPDYQVDPVPEESQFDDVPEEEEDIAAEAPAATEAPAQAPAEAEEVLQEETVMPKPPFMTNEERTLELQEPPIPQPTVFSDEMREIRQQESVPAGVVKEDADDVIDDVSDFFKPEA